MRTESGVVQRNSEHVGAGPWRRAHLWPTPGLGRAWGSPGRPGSPSHSAFPPHPSQVLKNPEAPPVLLGEGLRESRSENSNSDRKHLTLRTLILSFSSEVTCFIFHCKESPPRIKCFFVKCLRWKSAHSVLFFFFPPKRKSFTVVTSILLWGRGGVTRIAP